MLALPARAFYRPEPRVRHAAAVRLVSRAYVQRRSHHTPLRPSWRRIGYWELFLHFWRAKSFAEGKIAVNNIIRNNEARKSRDEHYKSRTKTPEEHAKYYQRWVDRTKKRFLDDPREILSPANLELLRAHKILRQFSSHIKPEHISGWSIHVFRSDYMRGSACNCPIGHSLIMISDSMMKDLPSINAVALVIGHEVAHVLLNHESERLGFSEVEGEPMRLRHEFEADDLGMSLAARAGYRPDDCMGYFHWLIRLEAKSKPRPRLPGYRTHPPTQERLARAQANLENARSEWHKGIEDRLEHSEKERAERSQRLALKKKNTASASKPAIHPV